MPAMYLLKIICIKKNIVAIDDNEQTSNAVRHDNSS